MLLTYTVYTIQRVQINKSQLLSNANWFQSYLSPQQCDEADEQTAEGAAIHRVNIREFIIKYAKAVAMLPMFIKHTENNAPGNIRRNILPQFSLHTSYGKIKTQAPGRCLFMPGCRLMAAA